MISCFSGSPPFLYLHLQVYSSSSSSSLAFVVRRYTYKTLWDQPRITTSKNVTEYSLVISVERLIKQMCFQLSTKYSMWVNKTQWRRETVPYWWCRYRECTFKRLVLVYDGCSPASSGTKTTSVAVSICQMNQVAEVRRAVLTLYSMNNTGNSECNTLAIFVLANMIHWWLIEFACFIV